MLELKPTEIESIEQFTHTDMYKVVLDVFKSYVSLEPTEQNILFADAMQETVENWHDQHSDKHLTTGTEFQTVVNKKVVESFFCNYLGGIAMKMASEQVRLNPLPIKVVNNSRSIEDEILDVIDHI